MSMSKTIVTLAALLLSTAAFAGGGFNNDCNGVGNCNTVNRVHNNNSTRNIDKSFRNQNANLNNNQATGGDGYGVGIADGGDARSNSRAYGGDGGHGGEGGTGLGVSNANANVGDTVATSGDSVSSATATGGYVGDTGAYSGSSVAGSGNSTTTVDGTGGTSNVQVEGGSTSFNSDTRALALSLPAATPGFGASAPCLRTTRGVTVMGVGASGSTEIDSECYQDQQIQLMFKNCMDVTQTYVAMGLMGEARDQMQACRVLAIKRVGTEQ